MLKMKQSKILYIKIDNIDDIGKHKLSIQEF